MTRNDTDVVIVLTTVPSDFDGDALIRELLDKRLVACVNILPGMRSVYRWQGKVEAADERQLLLKTRRPCIEALEAALSAAHPYDTPEFLVLPVSGGSATYLAWLGGETVVPRGSTAGGG
jgi:periplasmic divalent cation tolerance protein